MPYIEKSAVAEIRKDIKSTFPEYKFSIVRDNYSSINLTILSGPIDFGEERISVNQYRIAEDFKGEAKVMLQLLADFLLKDNKIVSEDGDYGSIPNYYINISVGRWDKPYQVIKKE